MRFTILLGVLAAASCGSGQGVEPAAVGTVVFEPPAGTDGETYVATEAEVMRSTALRQRVTERMHLELAADAVVVTVRAGTRVVEVGIRDADPIRAAQLCNGLVQAYFEWRLEREQAGLAAQEQALAAELDKRPGDSTLIERMKQLDLRRTERHTDVRVLDRCQPTASRR